LNAWLINRTSCALADAIEIRATTPLWATQSVPPELQHKPGGKNRTTSQPLKFGANFHQHDRLAKLRHAFSSSPRSTS